MLGIALVGGGVYVALKTGMEDTGPWMFLLLLYITAVFVPLAISLWLEREHFFHDWRKLLLYSLVPSTVATAGSVLLQLALVSTSVGKAGIITSLYVCILPFASCFFGYKLKLVEVIGGFIALAGLYFLAVVPGADSAVTEVNAADGGSNIFFGIGIGDILLVLSAFCWTAEIILIDVSLRYVKPFSFSTYQAFIGVVLLAFLMPFVEPQSITALANDFGGIILAILPELLYGGIIGGLSYALSIYVQLHLSPNRVGLLASTESLFAVMLGWIMLGETFNQREIIGAVLMFSSLVIVRVEISAIVSIFLKPRIPKQ